jgi:hypothetical protein
MMRSYRKWPSRLALGLATIALAFIPFAISMQDGVPAIVAGAALAKGGNNGNGNGGNSNDGGGGSGNGNAGGNGNGAGGSSNGNGSGRAGGAKGEGRSNTRGTSVSSTTRVDVRGQNIEVRYSNGMVETLTGSVYVMKDAKGRTIARRNATRADRTRLLSRRK